MYAVLLKHRGESAAGHGLDGQRKLTGDVRSNRQEQPPLGFLGEGGVDRLFRQKKVREKRFVSKNSFLDFVVPKKGTINNSLYYGRVMFGSNIASLKNESTNTINSSGR